MSLREASDRRSLPVTLRQVPEPVRWSALGECVRHTPDEGEKQDLLLAAVAPSPTVYFVAESARPLIEQWGGASNPSPLTEAETEALEWSACGLSQAAIASIQGVSHEGLKSRLESARRKLGAVSTLNAVAIAMRRGDLRRLAA